MDSIIVRISNWLLVGAILLALVLVLFVLAGPAHAGGCQMFFYKQQVAYVAPVYAAPVYYQTGRDIEAEAIAAKVAKLVIGQLRAELKAPQQVNAPRTAMEQHCAKCHSGATPKAGIVYDGYTALACVQVTAALRAMASDHMPKDHKLTPQQKGQIMEELLSLEQTADRPQPLEIPPPEPSGELK